MFFFCTLIPLGFIIAAFFVADSIRHREHQHHRWSSSIIIGVLASISSLSYGQCGSGEEWRWDMSPLTVSAIHRGWPFPWWGWVGLDVVLAPSAYFFFDLIFWTLLAAIISSLISLAQRYAQYETREITRIMTAGLLVVVA